MNTETGSEHKRRFRCITVIFPVVVASLVVVGIIGSLVAAYMALRGEILWWGGMIITFLGLLIAACFGYVLQTFWRRMLSIRAIRLCESDKLQIVTIGGKTFTATLPNNVEHVVVEDDGLTLAVKVGSRRFVVDSAEFKGSERVCEFFKTCLQKAKG